MVEGLSIQTAVVAWPGVPMRKGLWVFNEKIFGFVLRCIYFSRNTGPLLAGERRAVWTTECRGLHLIFVLVRGRRKWPPSEGVRDRERSCSPQCTGRDLTGCWWWLAREDSWKVGERG